MFWLSPKHKIIVLDLINDSSVLEDFYKDFVEDLWSISDKFDYKEFIGIPRYWSKELMIKENIEEENSIEKLLEKSKLDKKLQRKNELLISLLVWSINEISKIQVEEPENLLEKVKKKIVLFDWDQTNFIYKEVNKKVVYIQWLAGTWKTELLLHKLKEVYTSSDNSKIFFTCHNKVLSNNLKSRIPEFFNFMKVEKQIEWNKRLWVTNAWGSMNDKNSWLYRCICDIYNIPFYTYDRFKSFDDFLKIALDEIKKINPKEFAFDYIFIDESQDFSETFFKLCELVTRKKVYIAWDIFQDIFGNFSKNTNFNVDVALNKCYRTDPRTFMFAQSIWMWLFEGDKMNWLDDKEWKASWYNIERNNCNISLSRESIRRFEDLEEEDVTSMNIEVVEGNYIEKILEILKRIKDENPTVKPDDIGIVILWQNQKIFDFINKLEFEIIENIGYKVTINDKKLKKKRWYNIFK